MQERDGHGLHALAAQYARDPGDLLAVDRREHPAIAPRPLRHGKAQRALDQRRGRIHPQLVRGHADVAPQLQHVAEAAGRQERRAGTLPLDHGVGHERRGVREAPGARRVTRRGALERAQPLQQAP